MEGQKHIGVVVTTISRPDAAQAQAWEEKWRSEAASAAGHGGAVDRGIAFRVAPGYDLGGATHVAIYETQLKDVAAATKRVAADDGDGETTLGYTKIAEYGPVSDGRTRGVVLVFTDCDDPAEEDVFNEWYSGHLHHTVEAIDFYAATRYVSNDPSRTPSKYFAIYESQNDDPAQVQKDGVDWWVEGGFEGPKGMQLRNEVPALRID
ncbi:MAG: hypothetical protein JRG92_22960 [Deltaproteobacteria bacterium]|nr:hypothetical protein [Deltaproteobacteria bacterium]